MANIMFFNIPAHGHTNPTLGVVQALCARGHRVRYYSFPEFETRIRAAGAEFVSCEDALPAAPDDLGKRVGKDFSLLMELVIGVTEKLHARIEAEMTQFQPDCIVSDSVCIWGKLFAKRFQIPLVCSTTTMAFNRCTAKRMKQSAAEVLYMLLGMPKVMKKLARLEALGYEAKSVIALLQNDNETDTIVYTSRRFQPMAETFSTHYAFVGPVVMAPEKTGKKAKPLIYISLGTVLHKNTPFYRMCIKALSGLGCRVVMSVGPDVHIEEMGELPEGFEVHSRVNQMEVLGDADVFITHCGMNSVMESLYCGVPMVLFPQHAEERAVADRAAELGAGVKLRRGNEGELRRCVRLLLENRSYQRAAEEFGADMKKCGGAQSAADFIEAKIGLNEGEGDGRA